MYNTPEILPISNFSHITVPTSRNLSDSFLRMATYQNSAPVDATNALRSECKEFEDFAKIYKESINEEDFISEMDKTIGMMQSKFEKISKRLNLWFAVKVRILN